jgi:uncharacterized membrane protein
MLKPSPHAFRERILMSWAHIHLALNHIPVVGILLAILLLGAAVVRQNIVLERTSYWLLAGLALLAVLVYFTGEPAEELVEGLPGYSKELVEHHEEAALIATIGMAVVGLAGAVALVRGRREVTAGSSTYSRVVLLLAVVVGGLMMWTANLGGQIGHPEIRAIGPAAAPMTAERD